MKQFLSWFGKKVANAIVTAVLFMVAVLGIVYALSYPSTPPAGEVAGGNFMNYFNKILVNTWSATDGTVRKSLTTEQIGTLTDGKWCKVVNGKVDCTVDAPNGSAWLVTDMVATYSGKRTKTRNLAGICDNNTSWWNGYLQVNTEATMITAVPWMPWIGTTVPINPDLLSVDGYLISYQTNCGSNNYHSATTLVRWQ